MAQSKLWGVTHRLEQEAQANLRAAIRLAYQARLKRAHAYLEDGSDTHAETARVAAHERMPEALSQLIDPDFGDRFGKG